MRVEEALLLLQLALLNVLEDELEGQLQDVERRGQVPVAQLGLELVGEARVVVVVVLGVRRRVLPLVRASPGEGLRAAGHPV